MIVGLHSSRGRPCGAVVTSPYHQRARPVGIDTRGQEIGLSQICNSWPKILEARSIARSLTNGQLGRLQNSTAGAIEWMYYNDTPMVSADQPWSMPRNQRGRTVLLHRNRPIRACSPAQTK